MNIQWLLIGGPAHGCVFDLSSAHGGRVAIRYGNQLHTYDGENHHTRGALFRVGYHGTATQEQRYEVDCLIGEKQLKPVAGDSPW